MSIMSLNLIISYVCLFVAFSVINEQEFKKKYEKEVLACFFWFISCVELCIVCSSPILVFSF